LSSDVSALLEYKNHMGCPKHLGVVNSFPFWDHRFPVREQGIRRLWRQALENFLVFFFPLLRSSPQMKKAEMADRNSDRVPLVAPTTVTLPLGLLPEPKCLGLSLRTVNVIALGLSFCFLFTAFNPTQVCLSFGPAPQFSNFVGWTKLPNRATATPFCFFVAARLQMLV
jgi:hypothetical protein